MHGVLRAVRAAAAVGDADTGPRRHATHGPAERAAARGRGSRRGRRRAAGGSGLGRAGHLRRKPDRGSRPATHRAPLAHSAAAGRQVRARIRAGAAVGGCRAALLGAHVRPASGRPQAPERPGPARLAVLRGARRGEVERRPGRRAARYSGGRRLRWRFRFWCAATGRCRSLLPRSAPPASAPPPPGRPPLPPPSSGSHGGSRVSGRRPPRLRRGPFPPPPGRPAVRNEARKTGGA